MTKKLLLGTLIIGALMSANAQSTVWSDNFDDEDISDWMLVDADDDGFNWGDQFQITNDEGEPVTGTGLISRSWQTVALTPDNWAISPAINLGNASGEIMINWTDQAAAAAWDEENYTVYAATSNTAAALEASPVQFNEVYPGTGEGEIFERTLDLSSFAGEETVYIAFRHHDSEDEDFILIDDVVLTAETLGVANYSASRFSISPNPATDVLTISNVDKLNITHIDIIDINGRTVKSFGSASEYMVQINISDLAEGVYLLNIASDNGTITNKIIKN